MIKYIVSNNLPVCFFNLKQKKVLKWFQTEEQTCRKFDHLPITIKKFIKDQEKAEKERKI